MDFSTNDNEEKQALSQLPQPCWPWGRAPLVWDMKWCDRCRGHFQWLQETQIDTLATRTGSPATIGSVRVSGYASFVGLPCDSKTRIASYILNSHCIGVVHRLAQTLPELWILQQHGVCLYSSTWFCHIRATLITPMPDKLSYHVSHLWDTGCPIEERKLEALSALSIKKNMSSIP